MSALKLPGPFFTEFPDRYIEGEYEEVLIYPNRFDDTQDGLVVVQLIYPDGTIINNKGVEYSVFPEYTKNNVEKLPDRFIIDVDGRARMFTPIVRRPTGELFGYYNLNGKLAFIELPLETSLEHRKEEEGDEDDIMDIDPIPLKRRRHQDKVNIPGDMYKSYLAAPKRFAKRGEIAARTRALKKRLTDPETKDELYETLKKVSPSGYTNLEILQYGNWDKYYLGMRETQKWCMIVNKFRTRLTIDQVPEQTFGRNQIIWLLGAAPLPELDVKVMDRIILLTSINVDVLEKDRLEKMKKDYHDKNKSIDTNHRIVCIIDYYKGKPEVIQWIDSSTFITNAQQLLMSIAGGYIFDRGEKFAAYLPQNLKALGLTPWVDYLSLCDSQKNIPVPEIKYMGTCKYLTDQEPIEYQRGTYYGYGMCSLFAAWFSFYILFNYRKWYHSLPLLPLHNPREFLVFMWNTILAGELTWETIPPMIKRVVFGDKIKEYGTALLLGENGEYSEVDDPDSDVYKKFGEGMKKKKKGRFKKGSRAAKKYMAYLRSLRRT